jgi:hypothetical protein
MPRTTPSGRLPVRRVKELDLVLKRKDQNAEYNFDHAVITALFPLENKVGFAGLTVPQRRYLGCWYLEAEVNNGGFMQFFDNRGPATAREALRFLEDRGPRPVASILSRAMRAFPGGKLPRTLDKLQALTLGDFSSEGEPGPIGKVVSKADDRFFAGNYAPTLIHNRLVYIRDHAKHFFV